MNIILTYYKCDDDWRDELKASEAGVRKTSQKQKPPSCGALPSKTKIVVSCLEQLSAWEKAGEQDIDKMAGCFGKIMEEMFAYRQDEWEPTLRRMGFTWENTSIFWTPTRMWKDVKNGNYNPFPKPI